MSRRKKHPEHANHERWLVSYADFITLLFAFFVVMFSTAQVDQRKVGKLAMAVQVAFQELGVFSSSNTRMPLNESEAMPFSEVQMVENVATRTANIARIVSPAAGTISPIPGQAQFGGERGGEYLLPPDLKQLQQALEQALAPEIARHEVALKAEREGLVVSLREIGFFNSGQSRLRTTSQSSIDRIAELLAAMTNKVRIEGHTDNVPIHNAQFASNWELSTARATGIIQMFLGRYGFPPERLAAAGYAEFHPVADNRTLEGRAQNRRVDIVVLAPLPPLEPARPAESRHRVPPEASSPGTETAVPSAAGSSGEAHSH